MNQMMYKTFFLLLLISIGFYFQLKKRNLELEQARENLIERNRNELQLLKVSLILKLIDNKSKNNIQNESNAKDDQINNLQQLISQYELKFQANDKSKLKKKRNDNFMFYY